MATCLDEKSKKLERAQMTHRHGPGAVDLLYGLDCLSVFLELDEGAT